jgi:hypothetical protein
MRAAASACVMQEPNPPSYPAHPEMCELQASLVNEAGPGALIICAAISCYDRCVSAGFAVSSASGCQFHFMKRLNPG